MGAPKGNRFWELRTSHGTDRIFSEPTIMWDACVEYFTWCEENPLEEQDWVGKDGNEVIKNKMRAFTYSGLSLFLGVNSKYFSQFEASIVGREDDLSKGFSSVLSRIRDTIYTQKFEGAAAGLLNQNIIARDLGLSDKSSNTNYNAEVTKEEADRQAGVTIVPMTENTPPLARNESEIDFKRSDKYTKDEG